MKNRKFIIILLILIAIGFIFFGSSFKVKEPTVAPSNQTLENKDYFSYKGQAGKDAMALLKEKAKVEQDKSGLIVSINGRQALVSKRDYWAFYVNGKLASVGAEDYKTKDGDLIEWKIEKY